MSADFANFWQKYTLWNLQQNAYLQFTISVFFFMQELYLVTLASTTAHSVLDATAVWSTRQRSLLSQI